MSERPSDFAPPPDSGGRMGIGAFLAGMAHGLLVLALAWGVNWTSHTPEGVEAELWSAVPQVAAPRAAEPQPVVSPPEPAKPTPPPPKPKPESPPLPDEQEIRNAQIALEKAKREEQQLRDQQKKEEEREREKEREKDRQKERDKEAEKLQREAEKKAEAEKQKRQEAEQRKLKEQQDKALETARLQALKRIQGQAEAGDSGSGTAARNSGPSAGYAGAVKARVRPNIVFTAEGVEGNPVTEVEVRVAPDGQILSQRIIKSSGVKEWDDAVLRALERTEVLPKDNGKAPPSDLVLSFRPRD